MKLVDLIKRFDNLKSNQFTKEEKVAWVSELDSKVNTNLYEPYGIKKDFDGYTEDSNDVDLMIPDAFVSVYIHWLELKVDYFNGEIARYNNSLAMFNAEYAQFESWFVKNHLKPQGNFKI